MSFFRDFIPTQAWCHQRGQLSQLIQYISFEQLSGRYRRTTRGSFDPTTVKITSLKSRATSPAARTATTCALVVVIASNEAVRGVSVDGEGADYVDCDDDAPE